MYMYKEGENSQPEHRLGIKQQQPWDLGPTRLPSTVRTGRVVKVGVELESVPENEVYKDVARGRIRETWLSWPPSEYRSRWTN